MMRPMAWKFSERLHVKRCDLLDYAAMTTRRGRCPDCAEGVWEGNGRCRQCNGTGVNTQFDSEQAQCPYCKGTGVCGTCRGTGRAGGGEDDPNLIQTLFS